MGDIIQETKKQLNAAGCIITTALNEQFPLLKSHSLSSLLETEISDWKQHNHRQLTINNPFLEHYSPLREAEKQLTDKIFTKKAIEFDLNNFQDIPINVDLSFWYKQLTSTRKNNTNKLGSLRKHFVQYWHKTLDEAQLKWELEVINKERLKFQKILSTRFKYIRQISNAGEQLGFEPGLLWDYSNGKKHFSDINLLKKWANYLKHNEGVQKLCDLMGKLRQIASSEKMELVKTTKTFTSHVLDKNSREEIIGLKVGKDIEHILPQELALLSDPETAPLFDLKFLESQLMSFDFEGINATNVGDDLVENLEVKSADKLGPVILCIDTSGSMSGAPENIAKAITLTMATRAFSQKRACYLINFSTHIETLELTEKSDISKVIKFLKMSFHGGTDSVPALLYGIKKMQTENYINADLLMISDFVMTKFVEETVQSFRKLKKAGSRFYALRIGNWINEQNRNKIFDKEWAYHPATAKIKEINHIISTVSQTL